MCVAGTLVRQVYTEQREMETLHYEDVFNDSRTLTRATHCLLITLQQRDKMQMRMPYTVEGIKCLLFLILISICFSAVMRYFMFIVM